MDGIEMPLQIFIAIMHADEIMQCVPEKYLLSLTKLQLFSKNMIWGLAALMVCTYYYYYY